MQILTFTLYDVDFGVNLTDVMCVIDGRTNMAVLPSAPKYIRGVTTLHDMIVPIYSMAVHLGYAECSSFRYLVIVNVNELKIGIGADNVNKIIEVEKNEIHPIPIGVNEETGCFNRVISQQEQLILLVDAEALIPGCEKDRLRQIIRKYEPDIITSLAK